MRPILFELFDFGVPSYSVMMVLGYVAALATVFYVTPSGRDTAREDGDLSRPQAWDLFIVMVVSSVLGSKVGHVLFEAPGHRAEDGRPIGGLIELLEEDPLHWARLGESGYVWYGGLIGALLTAVFYFWRRPHLRAWLYADAFAPAIMTGAFLGRIGCFLAGCCYGVPTDAAVGIRFPGHASAVHPTQLYDAGAALILGAFLLWRFGRRRFDGQNIALLLMAYAVLRSITESFRGDPERGAFGPLSTSQLLSVPLFVAGALLYARLGRRSRPTESPAPGASEARSEPKASEGP